MSINNRKTCTKDAPMPRDDNGMWEHPDAECVAEEYNGLSGGGDYEKYDCPNCGLRFYVELPD